MGTMRNLKQTMDRNPKLWVLGFIFGVLFFFLCLIWFRAPEEVDEIWSAPPSPLYIEVAGVGRVAYWHVAPTAPQPNSVPILFLQGGPGIGISNLDIKQTARQFPDFNIYFVDQIGVGKSDRLPLAKVTLENSIRAIEVVSSKVIGKPALIVGGSWGAAIATRYAVQHPKRVHALLLTSPAGLPRVCADESASSATTCYDTKTPVFNNSISQYPMERQAAQNFPKATITPDIPTHIPNGRFLPNLNRIWIADKVEAYSPKLSAWLVPFSTRAVWDSRGISVSVNRKLRAQHTSDTIVGSIEASKIPTLMLRGSLDFVDLSQTGGYQVLFPNSRFVELKNETHALTEAACAPIVETRKFLATTVNSSMPKSCSNQLVPYSEIKGGYTLEADVRF
jgi:pimeloyl-ACP methyl ester carboxylesterase